MPHALLISGSNIVGFDKSRPQPIEGGWVEVTEEQFTSAQTTARPQLVDGQIISGPESDPYVPPVISPIDAAVAWMESQGFSGSIKMSTLQDELLQAKEAGALESKPKLVATYVWMQTVKGIAKTGSTAFPPAPFTFDQVFAE